MIKLTLGLIVSFILAFDTAVIFVATIVTLINIKTLKLIGAKYFFRDYIQEHLISIGIYKWIIFNKEIIKLLYVNKFIKDEFHPWLSMTNLSKMNSRQRSRYLTLLDKVRQKKHEHDFMSW